MQKITNEDLEMFKERSRTELRSNCDVSRLAWDNVVPALCEEVSKLRRMLERVDRFLGETIQCGVEGEMLDGRHVNVAASDLADNIDEVLRGNESADRPVDGMTFGQAIEAMKQGKKVARRGWNGKGMYLWLLPATEVKKEWCRDPRLIEAMGERDALPCLGSIRMFTATKEVLTGWLASQTDMLADDWMIVA